MGILDFFFPKYCVSCKKIGDYLCSDCFSFLSFDTREICLVCNRQTIDDLTHPYCRGRFTIDGCFASIVYKGVAKKLLYTFKYDPYVSGLQTILVDLFFEGLIQNEMFQKALQENPVLIPIPLHRSRERSRGYNQAALLAYGLSKKLHLQVVDFLSRNKSTRSQVGLKREKRMENLKGAFSLSSNPPATSDVASAGGSQYPTIFLVDDVLTTGATLASAAYTLKKHGAKRVFGLTLAVDQLAT